MRSRGSSAVRLELDVPTWPGNHAGSHLDVRLTAPDGYQATREIREFDVDTPIVALSANVFADEIQNAFESGMDDFLEKPIAIPRLLATLRQFLSTHA